jgi:hypothetical protein
MEINFPSNLRLIKLPTQVELTLFLIREELKNHKFTRDLNNVGFDTAFCSSDFSALILGLVGFENRSDEIYDWYFKLCDQYVQKVDLEEASDFNELAFHFYTELLTEKKKGIV